MAAVRSGTRQPQWAQLLLYTLRGAAVIRLSVKKKKKKTFERFQSMTRTVMLQQAAAAASDTEVDRR